MVTTPSPCDKARTLQRTILRHREGTACVSEDAILVESPLEIVINGVPWAALMCTPGSDEDLALGFCLTEGLLRPDEPYTVDGDEATREGLRIILSMPGGAARVHAAIQGRGMRLGASCSGNRNATCTRELVRPVHMVPSGYAVAPDQLYRLQTESEACQALFSSTGATHFCALYDTEQTLLAYAEDVGRHNALDKAVGQAFRQGRFADIRMVLLSSRLSFEMVQKAIAINAQVVAGFSAVTSRAVHLAEAAGLTLIGFLRTPRLNVYTHPERLGLRLPDTEQADRPGESFRVEDRF